jgi:hypothetical protein
MTTSTKAKKTDPTQEAKPKNKTPFIAFSNKKPDLRKKPVPLLSLQVTNPIVYIKSWWKRVMGKEGVDFRFRIKPLTAIGMTIVIATFGFGVGKITFTPTKPFIQYTPAPESTPMPTPDPWRKTAFSGTLRFSSVENRFYLLTTSSEAINLEVLENVSLKKLVGRRIFATGAYNSDTHILVVNDASDMEILPTKIESVPISPVVTPTPTPIPTTLPTNNPTQAPATASGDTKI